jgi:ankyrin repeat protein
MKLLSGGIFLLFVLMTTSIVTVGQADSIYKKDSTQIINQINNSNQKNDSISKEQLNDLLFAAAEDGKADDVVKYLMLGADVNARTYDFVTPLMYAAQNGHLDVVKILLFNGATINARPKDGASALIAATRFNHEDVMDYLIQQGANVDLNNFDSATALTYAAAYGYYIPADMLIFYGANVNHAAENGSTPLMLAAFSGSKDVVELLLNKGADVNAKDKTNWSALHFAVLNQNTEIVKLLIEKGATIDAMTDMGYTPLAIASETGNAVITDYLLVKKADATIKTNNGATPFRLALYNNNKIVLDTLKKHIRNKEIMPFFNDFQISLVNLDFNTKDFMYGMQAGIKDLRYNIDVNLGFNTRLWANRTLVPIDDNIFYQYWEKRSLLHLGIDKTFSIPTFSYTQHGIIFGVKGVYTYGKYISVNSKPEKKILFAPEIGYTISGGGVGAKLTIEYLDLQVKDLSPVRMNLGLYFTIKRKFYYPATKDIEWL